MIENSEVLFLWTETPLHAGSGSTVTAIDLPIQRNQQTGHPIIQASGVKGVLRDHCKTRWNDKALTEVVFGPEEDASAFGGAVSVSDACLLLFPVRSLRSVCVWITCERAIACLYRDLDRCGLVPADFPKLPDARLGEGEAWVSDQGSPAALPQNGRSAHLVLEEYTLTIKPAAPASYVRDVARWLEKTALPDTEAYAFWHNLIHSNGQSHLVLLSDGDFQAFVESATDVAQRIKVDDNTGTVNHTGLWTEENLPADSLLWNVLHAAPPRSPKAQTPPELTDDDGSKVLGCIGKALGDRALLQIGGDETVGRGLTRVRRFGKLGINPGGTENA